jgi:hypothetical protein
MNPDALRHPQRPRDHIRLEPANGIREQNPLARGRARTDVAGVALAKPAFRQCLHALHLHPCILLRQPPQDFARSVRGSVVHR